MASTSLDEETSKKVIRQVEFYFGDSNLPRDNFLKKTISESEDGLVDLALICSFTRMRGHLGLGDVKADGVPEDTVNAVAETLKSSDFLRVSEDGKKVGRKTELAKPEEVIEQLDNRTIAASPLPCDVKLEDVESYFTQFAKVNSIRLPRHVAHKNLFCGTALVEFSADEDAEKVLKESLTYAGAELELKPKKDFDAEREKQEQEFGNSQGHGNRKGSEQASYPKGLIVAFTLKKKCSVDDSKQNGEQEPVSEVEATNTNEGESVTSEVEASKTNEAESESVPNVSEEADKASENGTNGAENDEESNEKASEAPENDGKEVKDVESPSENDIDSAQKDEESKEKALEAPENDGKEVKDVESPSEGVDKKDGQRAALEGKSVVQTYKDNNDVVTREDLRPVFRTFGTVKYIDFSIGEESGYIRFEEPEAAQKARAAAVLTEEGGLSVKNYIATLEPVTGEAEKEYWSQVQGSQMRFRDKGHGHGHGHRGRGGKHHRNGRGRSRENDSPAGRPKKVQKVAS